MIGGACEVTALYLPTCEDEKSLVQCKTDVRTNMYTVVCTICSRYHAFHITKSMPRHQCSLAHALDSPCVRCQRVHKRGLHGLKRTQECALSNDVMLMGNGVDTTFASDIHTKTQGTHVRILQMQYAHTYKHPFPSSHSPYINRVHTPACVRLISAAAAWWRPLQCAHQVSRALLLGRIHLHETDDELPPNWKSVLCVHADGDDVHLLCLLNAKMRRAPINVIILITSALCKCVGYNVFLNLCTYMYTCFSPMKDYTYKRERQRDDHALRLKQHTQHAMWALHLRRFAVCVCGFHLCHHVFLHKQYVGKWDVEGCVLYI